MIFERAGEIRALRCNRKRGREPELWCGKMMRHGGSGVLFNGFRFFSPPAEVYILGRFLFLRVSDGCFKSFRRWGEEL